MEKYSNASNILCKRKGDNAMRNLLVLLTVLAMVMVASVCWAGGAPVIGDNYTNEQEQGQAQGQIQGQGQSQIGINSNANANNNFNNTQSRSYSDSNAYSNSTAFSGSESKANQSQALVDSNKQAIS